MSPVVTVLPGLGMRCENRGCLLDCVPITSIVVVPETVRVPLFIDDQEC